MDGKGFGAQLKVLLVLLSVKLFSNVLIARALEVADPSGIETLAVDKSSTAIRSNLAACNKTYAQNKCGQVRDSLPQEQQKDIIDCSQSEHFLPAQIAMGCANGVGAFVWDTAKGLVTLPYSLAKGAAGAPGALAASWREDEKCHSNFEYKRALIEPIKEFQSEGASAAMIKWPCDRLRSFVEQVARRKDEEVSRKQANQKKYDEFIRANSDKQSEAEQKFPKAERELSASEKKYLESAFHRKRAHDVMPDIIKKVEQLYACYTNQHKAKIACQIAASVALPSAALKVALDPRARALVNDLRTHGRFTAASDIAAMQAVPSRMGVGLEKLNRPPGVGESVVVPRSSGAFSEGKVIGFDKEGRAIVQIGEVEDGRLLVKSVSNENLYAPNRGLDFAEMPRGPPLVKIGDDVTVPRSDGSTSEGRVTQKWADGRVRVEFKDDLGRLAFKDIAPDQLTRSYAFKSSKVGDYVTGSGSIVKVDYDSPAFKQTMREVMDGFDAKGVGVHNPRGPPNVTEMRTASDAWLSQVKKFESPESGANYDRLRNEIIRKNNGSGDLGEIPACRGAVCRALSLIGSVALAESGFSTRVARGWVGGANGGAHAWIEFVDPNTNRVLGVLDSNYQRSFFQNPNDYYKRMQVNGPIKYTVVAKPR